MSARALLLSTCLALLLPACRRSKEPRASQRAERPPAQVDIVSSCQAHREQKKRATPLDPKKALALLAKLRSAVARGQAVDAEKTLLALRLHALPVITDLARDPKAARRELALDLIGASQESAFCGHALDLLRDKETDIRSMAAYVVGLVCTERSFLARLLAALERASDLTLRLSLVRAIGEIGDASGRPALHKHLARTKDPKLRHRLQLALVRLKDRSASEAFRRRLLAADARTRHGALVDLGYIRDCSWVAHFAALLRDERAIEFTAPNGRRWSERVCDIAVATMASLGVPFSSAAEGSAARLKEARRLLESASPRESPQGHAGARGIE